MKRKTVSTVIIIAGLLTLTLSFWAYGPYTTLDPVFMPGTQVETHSYVVWREGSSYYAKNGDTGEVTTDTNSTYLINYILDLGIDTLKINGIIYLDGSIIPLDNQTLDLYGSTLIQTKTGAVYTCAIAIASVSNVSVLGGTINMQGNLGTITTDAINIFQSFTIHGADPCENLLLKDIRFFNVFYDAIQIHNSSRVLVENIFAEDCGYSGVRLVDYSSNCTVTKSFIKDCGQSGIKDYVTNSDNIFSYNQIANTHRVSIGSDGARNQVIGNHISEANVSSIYTTGVNTLIANNAIYSGNAHGEDEPEIAGFSSSVIIGNTIYDCFSGIQVEANSTVTGNRVYSVESIGLYSYGHNNVFSDNFVISNYAGSHGLRIENSQSSTFLGGRYINCTYGIRELGTSDYNIIIGQNTEDNTIGILTVGANTQVNLCYNLTTWIA